MTTKRNRALFVVTSTRDAGELTSGYWFEELATPYYILRNAGWEVVIASPQGGAAPRDPMSEEDDWMTDATRQFASDPDATRAIENTVPLAEVDAAEYGAVFLVGGIAAMWDFPENSDLARILPQIDRDGGVVASVCHGAAGLIPAMRSDGSPLVAGRTIVSWTDDEERALSFDDKVPFLLETRLREQGANFIGGANFGNIVRVDGNIVTGQNPMSSAATAYAILGAAGYAQAAE